MLPSIIHCFLGVFQYGLLQLGQTLGVVSPRLAHSCPHLSHLKPFNNISAIGWLSLSYIYTLHITNIAKCRVIAMKFEETRKKI